MADKLEVGDRLHALFSDGEFYEAEVVAVSTAARRASNPVKVSFIGYVQEGMWLPLASLKSKKLPKLTSAAAGTLGLAAFEKGKELHVEADDGKLYLAEVVEVSKAKNRASAPIKVHWKGYTDASDEWVGADRIKSKVLKAAPKAKGKDVAAKEAESSKGKTVVDELVSAAWVIPVETDGALQNHTVVVNGGKILDILPTDEANNKYYSKKTTSLPSSALMPGLVNAHTHSTMVYLRGVTDDIALRDWLEKTIWPLEFKFCSAEFVKEGAELAILEMIMGGVTTFNDMYWFPEGVCEAVVKSGIRAAVGMIAIEFPFGGYGSGPDEYLAKGELLAEKYKSEELLSFTVSLHAPYTCSDATITKGGILCEKMGVPLHIHLHETSDECEASKMGNKESTSCHMSAETCTPLANLKRLGLVNQRLIAVHMNWLTDEEITWCAEAHANVVHCPSSNLKLASGFCRVADLLKAGVNVAIGTDGASSNNTLDVMAEMKLAAILAKGVSKDAASVPAQTALRMATLNGAKALGLDGKTGSLVVGKDADMIAVDFSGPATWPEPTSASANAGFDPVTHIVYSSTRDQVTDVWVRGKQLMRRRKVMTLDAREVKKAADKWGVEITKAIVEMRAGSSSS
mmetsp:Transcript_20581/g.57417  ORF Transcript_20581/g.57417 Transcript_20581/m.57417 type:complete len:629 (-) Transcript_20581:96-1982(-)